MKTEAPSRRATAMRAADNPFRAQRVLEIRFRPQAEDWDALLARVVQLDLRAAIVGAKGTGKSTLLDELAPRIEALAIAGGPRLRCKCLRLSSERPTFDPAMIRRFWANLEPRDVIFLDGAEQLSPWRWLLFRRQARRAAGLLITSHAPGLLPTAYRCETSPELLQSIVDELFSGSPDGSTGEVCDVPELFARHHGNLRDALRELYDRYAQREAATSAS